MAPSVAKDRSWFKTYIPFSSTLNGMEVLGIGTVEIPTKRSPNLSGVSAHSSLCLTEVLHVPSCICNIVGYPLISDGYEVTTSRGAKSRGTVTNSNGKNVAFFDPNKRFFTLKLRQNPAGKPYGPCPFEDGAIYWLKCDWDDVEIRKWWDFKKENGINKPISGSAQPVKENAPYTAEERAYLKDTWRGEYKFLLAHGLNIHKEEDREEGRSILRAMREHEDSDEDSDDDEYEFEGHQADYNFSHRQLDWIERNFKNSEQFMLSYGLKFYNDDDVDEAKAIADYMMRHGGEDLALHV